MMMAGQFAKNSKNGIVEMINKPSILNSGPQFQGNMTNFLQNVPLFRSLGPDGVAQVSKAMETVSFRQGECLFKQGEKGDRFYVITQGECEVHVSNSNFIKPGQEVKLTKDVKIAGRVYPAGSQGVIDKYDANRGYPFTVRILSSGDRGRCLPDELELADGTKGEVRIAHLHPGDYFGDQALLKGSARNATIIASADTTCAMLTIEKFQGLKLHDKLHFAKRRAVLAVHDERLAQVADNKDLNKTKDQEELIRNAILANKFLHEMVKLSDRDVEAMVKIAYKRTVPKGENIITQDDLFAEEFFIVENGSFQFHVGNVRSSYEDKIHQFQFMNECKAGGSFGEVALLYHCPRAATVTAAENSTVWVIDRLAFTNIMYEAHKMKLKQYMEVINNVQLFHCLLNDEKAALAESLYEKHYIKGEKLMIEGEQGNMFFILMAGKVNMVRQNVTTKTVDANEQPGQFFGERAILKHEPRMFGCVAASDDVTVAALSKQQFERLLGPLEEIFNEGADRTLSKIKSAGAPPRPPMQNITMNSLRRVGLLGCGGFGAVSLEEHIETGQTYALKQLSKGYIVKTRMEKSVMSEKNILLMCDSKFIIKLYATFKTKDSLYFLLEPAMGGELYATYHKYRFHGNSSKAKFYTAGVVYAFDHLHEKHIIYRDLKPENVLMDGQGHPKLTDMGLAKQTVTKTKTTCGTPDYFAPEVIDSRHGYGSSVDWWTMGVLVHELMSGHAPFEASSQPQIYQKVMRGVAYVTFPYKQNDPECVALVKALLVHEPNERLPLLPGGIANVKNHAWYNGFSWQDMWDLSLTAPYLPQIKSMTDISNFKAKESDMPPQIPYKDPGTGWDSEF